MCGAHPLLKSLITATWWFTSRACHTQTETNWCSLGVKVRTIRVKPGAQHFTQLFIEATTSRVRSWMNGLDSLRRPNEPSQDCLQNEKLKAHTTYHESDTSSGAFF